MHLHDVTARVIFKILGYSGRYRSRVWSSTQAVDWVNASTSSGELDYLEGFTTTRPKAYHSMMDPEAMGLNVAAMSATHSNTGVVGIMVAVAARSGTRDVKERLPADA